MDPEVKFFIAQDSVGQRLDLYLATQLNISRSRIQQSIDDGDVLLNNKIVKSSYKLREGDFVEVELPQPVKTEIIPENIPINVIYEDEYVLVIEKDPGVVVHPAAGISKGTIANALAFHLMKSNTTSVFLGETLRPGLVHRLDKNTSGLMVVAKNDVVLEQLANQFRDRTVEKHYTALVYGQLKDKNGVIEAPLARDKTNRIKMAVCKSGEGRNAISIYNVKQYYKDFTLLDIEIKTGRTHQIRVHCAYINHPVVADEIYGKGREANISNVIYRRAIISLGRQFLHASSISFLHPVTKSRLTFVSNLPNDLQNFLNIIAVD